MENKHKSGAKKRNKHLKDMKGQKSVVAHYLNLF